MGRRKRYACLFAVLVTATEACGGSGVAGAPIEEPASSGSGAISGALDKRAFDTIGSAWLIGKPDDAAQTRVVHLFDRPVKCSEISAAGWDETVADATQVLEIKLIGAAPGKYAIASNGRPGQGQADVNYTLTSQTGTPSEVGARLGSVELATLTDGKSASGTFELTFPGGNVSGDFQAEYCAAGREP